MAQPEHQARREIDRLLAAAGWRVCDLAEANIHSARGVAIREFPSLRDSAEINRYDEVLKKLSK